MYFKTSGNAQSENLTLVLSQQRHKQDCRFCPDDDDALLFLAVGSAAAKQRHQAWENDFVDTLRSYDHPGFDAIASCGIKMKPASASWREVEEATTGGPADGGGGCSGVVDAAATEVEGEEATVPAGSTVVVGEEAKRGIRARA